MKKRLLIGLLIVCIFTFSLTSCDNKPTQKSVLSVDTFDAVYTTEQLINEADLIVKGRVASVDDGIMTNPENDKTLKDQQGRGVANEQIHTYVFEIDTVYKGTYTEDTIEIKTSNGYALSPDLILYGEDETTILESSLERFDLEVGSECILTLRFLELYFPIRTGYYVHGLDQGVFSPDQAELFAK